MVERRLLEGGREELRGGSELVSQPSLIVQAIRQPGRRRTASRSQNLGIRISTKRRTRRTRRFPPPRRFRSGEPCSDSHPILHGASQFALSQAQGRLSLSRNRPPRQGVHRRQSGSCATVDSLRHRRRHRTAAGMLRAPPCTRRSMNWAPRETFRGYGPEQGYEFLRARHCRERLPVPRDRGQR